VCAVPFPVPFQNAQACPAQRWHVYMCRSALEVKMKDLNVVITKLEQTR